MKSEGFPVTSDKPNIPPAGGLPTQLRLMLHPEGARKIARLEGNALITLEQTREHIEIPDVMKSANTIRAAGGVRLKLEDCQQTRTDQWSVHILVLSGGRDGAQMRPIIDRLSKSPPRLEDAKGREFDHWTGAGPKPLKDGTELEFHYIRGSHPGQFAPHEPSKLVWEVPTSRRETRISFRFKDIPLP